jgi:hypothetical protein
MKRREFNAGLGSAAAPSSSAARAQQPALRAGRGPFSDARFTSLIRSFFAPVCKHRYPAASPSKSEVARPHGRTLWRDIDVAMRRGLHGGDERLPGKVALEAAKLLGRDDYDFVTPMHGHMLRSFAANAPHQLAEARLGVL